MTLPLGTTTNTLLTSNFLGLAASAPLLNNSLTGNAPTTDNQTLLDDSSAYQDPTTSSPLTETSLTAAAAVFGPEPPIAEVNPTATIEEDLESAARTNPRGSLALLAALATVTTLAVPGTAFAQDGVMEASGTSTYDPTTHLIVLAALFSIPILRGTVQVARQVYQWFKETFGEAPVSARAPKTGPPAAEETTPAEPSEQPDYLYPQPFEAINQVTGKAERVFSTVRDASIPLMIQKDLYFPLIGGASFFLTGGFDRPLWALAIDASAMGLAYLNRWYQLRKVDRPLIEAVKEKPLTSDAFKKHLERPLGVLGPPVPTVEEFHEDEFFRLNKRLFDGEPTRSRLRSYFALKDILQAAFLLVTQINDRTGSATLLKEMWRYALNSEILPADEDNLEAAHAIARQWAIQSSARMRANLSFDGIEQLTTIPEGAPVIMIGNHDSSMWPSFWAAFLMRLSDGRDIHGRPIADISNFALAPWMRLSPLSVLGIALQKLGLIYVPRKSKPKKRKLWKRILINWNPLLLPLRGLYHGGVWALTRLGLLEKAHFDWPKDLVDKAKMGIYPLGYPAGGREPACYNEAGEVIQSSPLANVLSTKNPHYFIARGIAEQAVEIASQNGGQTVYAPYIYTNGAYRVAHKQKKGFGAFVEPITTDQDVNYSVQGIDQVQPNESADAVSTRWEKLSIEATGTEQVLQEQVLDWLQRYRRDDARRLHDVFIAQASGQMAARDASVEAAKGNYPIHYLIAARITAIRPGLPNNDRRVFQDRFFDLLNNQVDHSKMQEMIEQLNHANLEHLLITLNDEVLQNHLAYRERMRLRRWLGEMNNQDSREALLADESRATLREMMNSFNAQACHRFALLTLLRDISIRVKQVEYKAAA